MNKRQVRHFDNFWAYVVGSENHLAQYSHVGYDPRYREGCRWENFEQAYRKIKPILRPLARPRIFSVPVDVPGLYPIKAETAHEALLHLFNPPEALFGSLHVLDSPECIEIKRQAQQELQWLSARGELPPGAVASPGGRTPPKPKIPIRLTDTGGLELRHRPGTGGKPVRALIVRPRFVTLLLILSSSDYRDARSGWDEKLWDAIWNRKPANGVSKIHMRYTLSRKPDGRPDGVNILLKRLIADLNNELLQKLGPPPAGRHWVIRVERSGAGQKAYQLTDAASWLVVQDFDDSREFTWEPGRLDGFERRNGRRRLQTPGSHSIEEDHDC